MYQFKGFTEKANKALNLAIESAEEMRHNYVGTEHILYGLVKEGSGVAATALNECGVTEDALREKLESINGTMSLVELTPDDFTPRTKRVLRAAVIISSKTGYTYVGTWSSKHPSWPDAVRRSDLFHSPRLRVGLRYQAKQRGLGLRSYR